MTKTHDDLEAVRAVAEALQPFDSETQARIVRWACERVGLAVPRATTGTAGPQPPDRGAEPPIRDDGPRSGATDVKSFVQEKQPKSDAQFAATVAYFYAFEARDDERQDALTPAMLLDACRKAGRPRPPRPDQTLRNAKAAGYFDSVGRGAFKLNSVGENLVAMVLPDGSAPGGGDRGKNASRKKTAKKPSKKTPAKKTKRR